MLAALAATLAMLAGAGTASAAIPSNFFTIPDQQGVNDVNADQNDLTQMGRDDTNAAFYKLFWSWDSTSLWTGTGQTGDACALFDSDGDGNVNYAVCARIENPNANPALATLTADSPFLFSCDDSKNDRCGQPTPLLSAGITTGTIGSGGLDRFGNLITDTDPFAPVGSDSPKDVTLQVNIPKILLNGGVLVNVCSYPSAGNGGNNNPFDCIANPGGGFLVIVKNAGTDTTTSFPFAVSPVPSGTGAGYTIVGSGQTNPISLIVGNATETVTETVPAGWKLTSASCTLSGNATGTFNGATNSISGISIGSGLETRCTFVNVKDIRALSLVKSASPQTYDAVNDVIAYSYLVTNTGNVRLAGPVTVADDKASVVCPALSTVGNADGFLDPAEAVTCTASYSITQADLNGGSVTNVAKASAGGTDSNQDSETVTAVVNKALALVKTASPLTYDAVGDSIGYSYLVTNSGNVRLAGPVTVADDKASVSCPAVNTVGNLDSFLDPGEAVTCTASYSITQADLNGGSVTNVAKASADEIDSNPDSETVDAVQTKTLSLDKVASPLAADAVGDAISYSYLVTNTGNVRLAGPVTVADDKASVSCPAVDTVGNLDSFLDPGEAVTCTASYSITQADLNSGSVTNTAKATVGGIDSNEDKATVTVTPPPVSPPPAPPVPPAPLAVVAAAPVIDLSITKTDRPDPVFVGAQLVYTLTVRNAGPDTATNVRVSDALPAATRFVSVKTSQGTCTGGGVVRCSLGSIAPGGRAVITIVVRPIEPGALINTAYVVGNEPESNTANNRASTPTLVRGPFRPPVATCPTLTVQQRSLSVGQRSAIRVLVSDKGRGVRGVRILVTAPGLWKAATTDGRGRVAITVRPPRAGIAEIRMTNQPSRCSTRRIGVVGVFQPPSVTG